MHLGKKGAAISWPLSTIGSIILALVVFSVIVMVIFSVFSSQDLFSDWVCKTSVAVSSWGQGLPKKIGFDTIFCYTNNVESEAENKEDALEDIAEHMRKCWNMWGEGKLNPEGENIWEYRQYKCFTCEKLSFSKLEQEVSTKDINNYLEREWSPKKSKLRGEVSYWNYFKQNNPINFVNIMLPTVDKNCENEGCNVIDRNGDYAVIYYENIKPSVFGHLVTKSIVGAVGGATLCGIGLWTGAFTWGIGTGATLIICGSVGAGGASFLDYGLIQIQELFETRLKDRGSADGIGFETYDSAKKNCVTVVKVKSELFEENE